MSSCKECGFELTEESNFCPNCGEKILRESETKPAVAEEETELSVIMCPDCGQENTVDAKFCMVCGVPLQKQQSKDEPTICGICGEENPPGSDFCGSCGAVLGQKEEISYKTETDSLFSQYLNDLDERMKGENFHIDHIEEKNLGCSRVYHRKGKLSKLGVGSLDVYFAVTWQQAELDANTLRAFISGVFRQLEQRKNIIMKSLQPLAVFPVIVTANAGNDSGAFISSYCTPHLGLMEFPVVVELSKGRVLYYTGNPIWGGPFYKNARKMVDSLLVPA